MSWRTQKMNINSSVNFVQSIRKSLNISPAPNPYLKLIPVPEHFYTFLEIKNIQKPIRNIYC